jgi:aquaporin Z
MKFVTFLELRTPKVRSVAMSTNVSQIPEEESLGSRAHLNSELHWREYAMEGVLLGLFMVSAYLFTLLFELPASPVREVLPSPFIRRALTGGAMGLTAIALIYSPWGQRSGAHMNPSVTLTFARLRKIRLVDALFYVFFQFAGAVLGVLLVESFTGFRLADPHVQFAATVPGEAGSLAAAFGEFLISFLLMSAVLVLSNHPKLNRLTGVIAGVLVATYIALESPFSGMSMNPARTFGSALPSGIWQGFAIYLLVPPLAMLIAAQAYAQLRGKNAVACCKLDHSTKVDCIFCGMKGTSHE